jgi:hypothetical protein
MTEHPIGTIRRGRVENEGDPVLLFKIFQWAGLSSEWCVLNEEFWFVAVMLGAGVVVLDCSSDLEYLAWLAASNRILRRL